MNKTKRMTATFIGLLCLIVALLGLFGKTTKPIPIEHQPEQPSQQNDNIAITNAEKQQIPIVASESKPSAVSEPNKVSIRTCSQTEINEDTEKALNEFVESLSLSRKPNDQLAYLLFSREKESEDRTQLFISLLKSSPNNDMLLYKTLGRCITLIGDQRCDLPWHRMIESANPNNGALWSNLASYYGKRGDIAQSERVLKEVINSPLYNDYSFDLAKLFIDVSEPQTKHQFFDRASRAIGYFAASASHIGIISDLCVSGIEASDTLRNTCLNLGKKLFEHGNTLLLQTIGLNLQKRVYEAENNAELAEQLKVEQAHAMKIFLSDDVGFDAGVLSLFDEQLFRNWLDNAITLGEGKAGEILKQEAINLSADPFYNPCPEPSLN